MEEDDPVGQIVELAGCFWADAATNEAAVELADAMIAALQRERDSMQAEVDAARRN